MRSLGLFTAPRGPSREEIRARTSVQFACYGPDELFVAGDPAGPTQRDVTVELSVWSMSTRLQARSPPASPRSWSSCSAPRPMR